MLIIKTFLATLALSLAGCGYGVRGEVGPSWTIDEGPGAAAQVGAPLAFVAFGGLNYSFVPSLWGRVSPESAVGGVGLGVDMGWATTASTGKKADSPRRGFGGSLTGSGRFGTDGSSAVVGVNFKHSTATVSERHKILLSRSEKGGSTFLRWCDWIYRGRGVTAQVGFLANDPDAPIELEHIDLLYMMEWMSL